MIRGRAGAQAIFEWQMMDAECDGNLLIGSVAQAIDGRRPGFGAHLAINYGHGQAPIFQSNSNSGASVSHHRYQFALAGLEHLEPLSGAGAVNGHLRQGLVPLAEVARTGVS